MFHKARQRIDTADLLFTVGTSGLVWPAAGFPERAKAHNAYVMDINPNREAFTKYVDLHLSGTSGAILPALAQALRKQMSA
jgi:NAD-dependent deacetylase